LGGSKSTTIERVKKARPGVVPSSGRRGGSIAWSEMKGANSTRPLDWSKGEGKFGRVHSFFGMRMREAPDEGRNGEVREAPAQGAGACGWLLLGGGGVCPVGQLGPFNREDVVSRPWGKKEIMNLSRDRPAPVKI